MSKYRAQRTEYDGITFHSKKECFRYQELKILERSGIITGLELQPRFPLVVNGIRVCDYLADFAYKDQSGRTVIEDVKGVRTPVYKLKRKLFEACFKQLRITES